MRTNSRLFRPLGPSALLPNRPWWEAIPDNFAQRSERFEVRMFEHAELNALRAIDSGVQLGAASALVPLFLPLVRESEARRQVEAFHFYRADAFLRDPDQFYRRPPDVRITRSAVKNPLREEGAIGEDIFFDEAFEPVNPAVRARYLSFQANRRSHARHIFHGDRPRPTIIALHGFWASFYPINTVMLDVAWWYRLGFDIVMPVLPFHGVRKMKEARFSGHGFLDANLAQTCEAVAHSISDLRVYIRYLRAYGVPSIGATGLSMGGFMTALLASLEPDLAFAIPKVPAVSLVDLLLTWQPIAKILAKGLRNANVSIPEARRLFAVTHALSFTPAVSRTRLMVLGGIADCLAPPSHARLLADHWENLDTHFFPGNHTLNLGQDETRRAISEFLRRERILFQRDHS